MKILIGAILLWGVSVLLEPFAHAVQVDNGGHGPGSYPIAGDGATPSMGDILGPLYSSSAALKHLARVGVKGDAEYSVPISLPPSLLSPSLSLEYSSGGDAGVEIGQYGWSLGGILQIEKAKGSLQDLDTYTMSGPISGNLIYKITSGSTKYYTLQSSASGSFIKASVTSNVWKIESGGLTYSLSATGGLKNWRVTQLTDKFNNKIAFIYDTNGRLSRIEYGGTTSIATNIKVRFTFKTTLAGTGNAYKERVYSNGNYVVLDRVLDKIEIQTDNPTGSGVFSRVNAYTITTALQDGVDTITKVRYEGSTSSEYEDIATFTYLNINTSSRDVSAVNPAYPSDVDPTLIINTQFRDSTLDQFIESRVRTRSGLADLNGDGKLDRVLFSGDTGYSSHTPLQSILAPTGRWTIETLEKIGDTSDSIAGSYEGVYEWQPWVTNVNGPQSAINESENNLYPISNHPYTFVNGDYPHSMTLSQLTDVDGDGIQDLLVSKNSTTSWQVYYGTGKTDLFTSAYNVSSPPGGTIPYSSGSLTYKAQSFNSNQYTLAMPSKRWAVIDVDNDGWADVFSGNGYFRKIPDRAQGWESWVTLIGNPWDYVTGVKLIVFNDPVFRKAFPNLPPSAGDLYKYTAKTFTVHSYRDLNGDGFLDAVDSSAVPWKVRFGKGVSDNSVVGDGKVTFLGFESTWTNWDAPRDSETINDEGYPTTTYFVQYEDPPVLHTHNGHNAVQTHGMLDVDGDGKTDYVSVAGGLYYRNLGNGFEATGRALPSWFPSGGITKTPLMSAEAAFLGGNDPQDYYTGSASYPSGGIMDLDGDGRLDVAMNSISNQQVEFGKSLWPFLLIKVDNKKGAKTTLGYKSTSTMDHSDPFNGGASTLNSHQPVVYRVFSEDTFTGQTAETFHDYQRGVRKNGIFQGFGFRTQSEYLNGELQSITENTYELSQDFPPLPTTTRILTDRNLCSSYQAENSSCTPNYVERIKAVNGYKTYGAQSQYRLLDTTTVTDSGETGVGSPIIKTRTLTYDADSNPLTIVFDGGGNSTLASTTTLTWAKNTGPSMYKLSSMKVTNGTTELSYKRFSYDEAALGTIGIKGFLSKSESCMSATGTRCSSYATWQYTDVGRGQIKKTTFPSNTNNWIERTYGYNGVIPTATTNYLGHTTSTVADSKGQITSATSVNGVTSSSVYDGLGRVIEKYVKSRAAGATAKKVASYTYQTSTIPNYTTTKTFTDTGAVDTESTVDYDGFGHAIRSWVQHPTDNLLKTESLYSLNGTLLQTSYSEPAGNHLPLGALNFTNTAYKCYPDAFGSCRWSTSDYTAGNGIVSRPPSKAGESITIDSLGYEKRILSNAIGKPTAVYESQMGVGSEVVTGSYTWNAQGRLTKIVFGAANVGDTFAYTYDQAGRIVNVTYGANGTAATTYQTYTYSGSRYQKRVDAAGLSHEVTVYDEMDRVKNFKISDQVSTTTMLYWATYDTLIPGELTSTTDPSGFTSYTYDDYARLASATRNWSNGGFPTSFQYTYDLQGRPLAETYPSGMVRTNTYQKGTEVSYTVSGGGVPLTKISKTYQPDTGLLQTVTAPSTNLQLDFGRDASGQRLLGHLFSINGNQSRRSFAYASNGRINSIDYTYSSANGATGGGAGLHVFEYDELNRLTLHQVGNTSVAQYGYEAQYPGMSTLSSSVSQGPAPAVYVYTYPATYTGLKKPTSRATGVKRDNYTYDTAGRVQKWDSTPNGTSWTYRTFKYDGNGRVRTISLGQTPVESQRLTYDFNGNLIEIKVPDGANVKYIQIFMNWHNDSAQNRVTENVSKVLDIENGQRAWKLSELAGGYTSRQYGNMPAVNSAPGWSRAMTATGETFQGRGNDEREGYHGGQSYDVPLPGRISVVHLGARTLMQRDSNWLQPDPMISYGISTGQLLDPRGISPYAYARRNPMNFSDSGGFATGPSTPGDVPITTDVIQIDKVRYHREDIFAYPTPLTPTPTPTPTSLTPTPTPLTPTPQSYDSAMAASSRPPLHVTWEAYVDTEVEKEVGRVAQRHAQDHGTVGVANSKSPIVNRTIGEDSAPMRLLGTFGPIQEFSIGHDPQAAHAQASGRSPLAPPFPWVNTWSAVAGGAAAVLWGPEAGLDEAAKVWKKWGYDPGP